MKLLFTKQKCKWRLLTKLEKEEKSIKVIINIFIDSFFKVNTIIAPEIEQEAKADVRDSIFISFDNSITNIYLIYLERG